MSDNFFWRKENHKPKLTNSKDLLDVVKSHIVIAPLQVMPINFPFLKDFMLGILPTELLLVGAKTGSGKCLGKDTPVIMHDGSIKMVQDIQNGELVMGPDSKPRKVSGVTKGFGKLYKITPTKGNTWVCNEDHILSLKHTETNEVLNIELKNWLKLSKTEKHKLKQWRSGISFPKKDLPIDPYVVGVWLGDGAIHDARITISHKKTKVLKYLKDWASKNNLNTYTRDGSGCTDIFFSLPKGKRGNGLNPFYWIRKNLCKDGLKFITKDYLTGSEAQRKALLSGLLDTDGYYTKKGYDFISKSQQLSENVCFLARSLGLSAYLKKCTKKIKSINFTGTYYRVSINGCFLKFNSLVNTHEKRLQKKSVLKTGFKVECIGEGEYFGFTLDKDHLFLLGDFTVTHNTQLLTELALMWTSLGKRVAFIALEAEPEEIEQRIYYKLLCQAYLADRDRDKSVYLDFRRWRFGLMQSVFEKYEAQVDPIYKEKTAKLYTHYMQKTEFTIIDLVDLMDDVQQSADVCIIDHLHYFDLVGSTNDMQGIKQLMKRVRQINLEYKIPFVMAAHLRKDVDTVVPNVEDFMGSSDIPKIATSAILIAPKPDSYNPAYGTVTTLFSVPKLRGGGGTRLLGEVDFSISHQMYLPTYTLSTQSTKGDKIYALERENYPRWAKTPEDQYTVSYDF